MQPLGCRSCRRAIRPWRAVRSRTARVLWVVQRGALHQTILRESHRWQSSGFNDFAIQPCYGTNPILNDLIVAVAFDKTILALIPVKFDGNIILLTWKVAGAPTVVLFVPIRTT